MPLTDAAPDRAELLGVLAAGLKRAESAWDLTLSDDQRNQLIDYLLLMHRWNRIDNLTAVRDAREMVQRHILDSLSVAPFIRGQYIMDLGTGAGLPGIPLAIAFPQLTFFLVDSAAKRIRFVTQAIGSLGLENVTARQIRAEELRDIGPFDHVISRAFTSLSDFVAFAGPHLSSDGVILAMKGKSPDEEIESLKTQGLGVDTAELFVPDEDGERCLVMVKAVG